MVEGKEEEAKDAGSGRRLEPSPKDPKKREGKKERRKRKGQHDLIAALKRLGDPAKVRAVQEEIKADLPPPAEGEETCLLTFEDDDGTGQQWTCN